MIDELMKSEKIDWNQIFELLNTKKDKKSN